MLPRLALLDLDALQGSSSMTTNAPSLMSPSSTGLALIIQLSLNPG
jgi:hypothetical protein